MRRSHYNADIRVLLCESCGSPLEASLEAGAVTCLHCGGQNMFVVRNAGPASVMPIASAPVDEATRLARLRGQDGVPMTPPDSIRRLLVGSSFDPAKLQEAFTIYQATRREVQATQSPEAAERLYFLTLIANNYYGEHEDHVRRRAILETSLDTLYLPRHKQVMRATLASAAAKVGDLRAAEQWLAPCDPRAEDIESDSAYRNARAYIETVKGNYRAVLDILGHRDDEIPIVDARDATCAVLRANAHEKQLDMPAAVEALRARMGKENAQGRAVMQRFIALNAELSLCPLSFAQANAEHTEAAANSAAGAVGGGVGTFLMFIGIFSLVLGVGLAIGLNTGSITDSVLTALGPGIGGVVVMLVGYRIRVAGQEAAYMRRHGVQARGVVVGIKQTGTKINNVPLMEVQVTVMRPDNQPYQASFRQLMQSQVSAQFRPGLEVSLRVHPQRPEKVMLEIQ